MNNKLIKDSLILFLLLSIISIFIGMSRYFIENPLIFVDSFNKNKFVENPKKPQEIPAQITHEWSKSDSAVFIDTRTLEEFELQTIKNAILWEDEKIKEMIAVCRQNHNKKIVFFCAIGCDHAERAANRMSKIVPQQLYIMFDGFEVWQDSGFPMGEPLVRPE